MDHIPIFVEVRDRAVILVGDGKAAEGNRRLLEKFGARVVSEAQADTDPAKLAVVALDEGDPAIAVARLRGRGVLVTVPDRFDLCDFFLPAIVDRDPMMVAICTGGISSALAAALRQRLETLLPMTLGLLTERVDAAQSRHAAQAIDPDDRRRLLTSLSAAGAPLDPLAISPDAAAIDALLDGDAPLPAVHRAIIRSDDPDQLTIFAARLLAQADRVYHSAEMPVTILSRARAAAKRIVGVAPAQPETGLTAELVWKPD